MQFKTGDLVKILELNKYGKYIRSKNYSSPCIFIDHSIPYDITQIDPTKKWYKVLMLKTGKYEWFDEPYWRLKKM